jgi:hypothetical protein
MDIAQNQFSKRFHLTLNDIMGPTLAKLALIFQILEEIRAEKDSETKLELYATLTYLYTSAVMPSYCEARSVVR